MIDFLSLGMGVQSSELALLACRGELLRLGYNVKAAIFADTQAEPDEVYEWMEALKRHVASSPYPFPIYVVSQGNLTEDSLKVIRSRKSGKLYQKNLIPLFVKQPDGRKGMLMRKCTSEYKIRAIQREQKRLIGAEAMRHWRNMNKTKLREWAALEPIFRRRLDPKEFGIVPLCRTLIGISTDEVQRVKPSREPFSESRWPLLELNMSRDDCKADQQRHLGHEAPRSACVYCPYHSDAEWLRLKAKPNEWKKIVAFDRALRKANALDEVTTGSVFLHAKREPIDEIEFMPEVTREGDDFEAHCEAEGMCGL